MTAPDLLTLAVDAAGGQARWQRVTEIRARLRSGGFALAARGKPRAFRRYEATIATTAPRVVVAPYARPGARGVFEGDRVRIESGTGETLAARDNPRARLGHGRRHVWWDGLDALYFAGYALWNYFNAPFLLQRPGFETAELDPWKEGDEWWRRLRVRFPSVVPTHSPEQVFYFDIEGRLRRHDYTAEVFGRWARAAHYTDAHREFDGLVLPTRRRVYPRRRDGRRRPFPTLVWIDVDDVSLS
jgi:hypothetical protein